MRLDIRKSFRSHETRTYSCTDNIPLNSTIQVKVNGKITPCKTTSHRKGDLVEVSANGKKFLATWWFGKWETRTQI